MKLYDIMLYDWFKHINYDFGPITAPLPTYTIPSLSSRYEYIQVTEDTFEKDWTYIDQLRPIGLTPETLIANNFHFNTLKCSYDFNYGDGLIRLVFPTNIFNSMTIELTLFFSTFKFHGYCCSVDKLQKLIRICGLIDLANNFKIAYE